MRSTVDLDNAKHKLIQDQLSEMLRIFSMYIRKNNNSLYVQY